MTKRFNISLYLSVMIHAIILLFIIRIKTPESNVYEDKNKFEMNFIMIDKSIRSYNQKTTQANVKKEKIYIFESEEKFNLNKISIPNIHEKSLFSVKKDIINDIPLFNDNKPLVLPGSTKEPQFLPQIEEPEQKLNAEKRNSINVARKNSIFKWKGSKRDVEIAYPMPMPEVLKKIGQNVDVKAEIVVNYLGNVERVKIIKSSGFLEVDNAVENALLRYKFTSSADKRNETGVVFIKFILEMED